MGFELLAAMVGSPVIRSARDRLVAVALAEAANHETATCWPSVAWIQARTDLSRCSVLRALRSLTALGVIETQRTGRASVYVVRCPTLRHQKSQGETSEVSQGDIRSLTERHQKSHGETSHLEPGKEPGKNQEGILGLPRRKPRRAQTLDLFFGQFWDAYPKKRHRPDALAAWQQIAGANHLAAIVAGITRWKGSRNWQEGFIEDPATFLRQRQWEDSPEPGSVTVDTEAETKRLAAMLREDRHRREGEGGRR